MKRNTLKALIKKKTGRKKGTKVDMPIPKEPVKPPSMPVVSDDQQALLGTMCVHLQRCLRGIGNERDLDTVCMLLGDENTRKWLLELQKAGKLPADHGLDLTKFRPFTDEHFKHTAFTSMLKRMQRELNAWKGKSSQITLKEMLERWVKQHIERSKT